MEHPLGGYGFAVGNFKCFASEELDSYGFIQPINVLIGRNNSGKSAMIDALEVFTTRGKFYNPQLHGRGHHSPIWRVYYKPPPEKLDKILNPVLEEAIINKLKEANIMIEFVFGKEWNGKLVSGFDKRTIRMASGYELYDQAVERAQERCANYIKENTPQPAVRRVSAERRVQQESLTSKRDVSPNGDGVTNIVRAFLSDYGLDRREVEDGIKSDLNTIFKGDADFKEIGVTKLPDTDTYEIFLHE